MTDLLELAATPRVTAKDRQLDADLAAARARDEWRREHDYALTADELALRCHAAVGHALPALAREEREDLAQELAIYVAKRVGWRPLASEGLVVHKWLMRKAVGLAKDLAAASWRTARDESLDSPKLGSPTDDDDDAPSALAAALPAGSRPDAADERTGAVAAALACADGSADADAVAAALAGWKAGDLAAARDYTADSARDRLSRGRRALRERFTPTDEEGTPLPDARELAEREVAARCEAVGLRDADYAYGAAAVDCEGTRALARERFLAPDGGPLARRLDERIGALAAPDADESWQARLAAGNGERKSGAAQLPRTDDRIEDDADRPAACPLARGPYTPIRRGPYTPPAGTLRGVSPTPQNERRVRPVLDAADLTHPPARGQRPVHLERAAAQHRAEVSTDEWRARRERRARVRAALTSQRLTAEWRTT